MNINQIQRLEFDRPLTHMDCGKEPGVDNIPTGLLRSSGDKAVSGLFRIFSEIYETGRGVYFIKVKVGSYRCLSNL